VSEENEKKKFGKVSRI
jgi:hypothetical protein